MRRTLLAVVAAGLLLLVVLPAAAAAYVLGVSHRDDRTASDVIVVLGAAQYWSRPSPVLAARLDHARTLYREHLAPRIVTVGGNQPGDITTEAQAGRAYLMARGVPATDVRSLPTGNDTLTSLVAVADLMADNGWTSATIVTDPAHEARSQAMARALGIDAHTSPTQQGDGSQVTASQVVRESAGLLWFWAVDRWGVAPVVGPQAVA